MAILLAGGLASHQAEKLHVFRVRLAITHVEAERGFAFVSPIVVPWLEDTFTAPPRLFEDDRPLGPGDSARREVRSLGEGRYGFWEGTLRSSSSDGTDPRTNGRRYHLERPWPLGRRTTLLSYLLLGVVALWSIVPWLSRAIPRRRKDPSAVSAPGTLLAQAHREWAWTSILLGVSLLFAFPLLVMLICHGDFIPIAKESLAYRFFACGRTQAGEGGSVWLPQGYATGAIQQAVLGVVDGVGGRSLTLQDRLWWFSVGSLAANVLASSLLMLSVGRSESLLWSDKLLIGLVALVPIYGTNTAGFSYSSLPDYLHLDMVLVTAGVWLFLLQWRGRLAGNAWSGVAILGAFQCLLLANKVTLATVGAIVALPALLERPERLRVFVARLVLWLVSSSLRVLMVMLAFYQLRVGALLEMLPNQLHFMLTAEAEPQFWAQTRLFFVTYGYAYFVALWAAACVVAAVAVWRGGRTERVSNDVVIAAAICGLAQLYTVYRRSAGTTAFEAATLLIAFGAIALAVIPRPRVMKAAVLCVVGAAAVLCVATFPLADNLLVVTGSAARAEHLWQIHSEILRIAAGRPIVVVFPDNSFHHEGVHELLLKGAADFPTWDVSSRGQWIIDRYAPGTTFRYKDGPTPLSGELGADAVVLWFDKPDLPSLTERYTSLAHAVRTASQRDAILEHLTVQRLAGDCGKTVLRDMTRTAGKGVAPRRERCLTHRFIRP